MFWGICPALDLQEQLYNHKSDDPEELNILLIGSCDARHILKTLAKRYRHKQKQINIFVIESCLELIARQLMLISIVLEDPQNLGLLEKSRLFLEIYGNSLLRPSSSKYMISKSKHLIKMITDLDYMSKMMPILSFDAVKYRERDYIEMLLQFWHAGNTNIFDICELWDKRMRNYLGARYDCKLGVFDWDYNMRLRDIGGSTVSSQEYKHFRTTGMAFTWLETEGSRPNNTLSAGVVKIGDQFYHRGYVGDIVTGPYIAYGLDCEDEEMMRSSNGVHIKRATDISERNIMRMIYEIQNNRLFNSSMHTSRDFGTVVLTQNVVKISSETDIDEITPMPCLPAINIQSVNISFHSPTALDKYSRNESFLNKFDIVFASHNCVDRINSNVISLIKNDGLIILEAKKFILDMKKDDIKAFSVKINDIVRETDCESVEEFLPLNAAYAKLRVNRK